MLVGLTGFARIGCGAWCLCRATIRRGFLRVITLRTAALNAALAPALPLRLPLGPKTGACMPCIQPSISLIDPIARTMDVFRLEFGRWSLLGSFAEKTTGGGGPFQEIEINLGELWLESLQPQTDVDGG
jgi:hypothetical protein